MPYKISIPLSYQSIFHTFPPTYTTTASRIYLSDTSPLSRVIYTSALEWGWHVAHQPPWPDEKWTAYVARRKRRGWLNELWKIWQRETGVRIKAENEAREGMETRGKRYRKELGRWMYKWVVVREEIRVDFGEGRGRTERREGDVFADEDVEVESLKESLVERLEALDMDRRRREVEGTSLESDEGTNSVDGCDAEDSHDERESKLPGRPVSV